MNSRTLYAVAVLAAAMVAPAGASAAGSAQWITAPEAGIVVQTGWGQATGQAPRTWGRRVAKPQVTPRVYRPKRAYPTYGPVYRYGPAPAHPVYRPKSRPNVLIKPAPRFLVPPAKRKVVYPPKRKPTVIPAPSVFE